VEGDLARLFNFLLLRRPLVLALWDQTLGQQLLGSEKKMVEIYNSKLSVLYYVGIIEEILAT
jgi:hypothetical protein